RVKFQAPKVAAPPTRKITSQRCRTENARMPSIMFGLPLTHLRFHYETVLRDVPFAGRKPTLDLDKLRIGIPKFDRPGLDLVSFLADEYDRLVLQRLDSAGAHGHRHRACREHQACGDEEPWPQAAVRICQHHAGKRGLRLADTDGSEVGNAALD